MQTPRRTGTLTLTLLWKVPSRLWTSSPASLLLRSLQLLVLESLWSLPMRAHTLNTSSSSSSVSGAFLTTSTWYKWPHCLCHFLWLSSFTLLEQLFFCVSFIRILFWSFMQLFPFSKGKLCPRQCILRLIRGLKNSQAHTKVSGVRTEISLCLKVCLSSNSLWPLFWKPLLWNYRQLIEWAQSPGTRRCSSLCDLYNHCH